MKYHILTFGCQMNKSDSERVASFLESKGLKEVDSINKTDILVVNMCSVRQTAVDRIFGLSKKIEKRRRENKRFRSILTGCILEKDKKKFEKVFDDILDIKSLSTWLGDKEKDFFSIFPKSSFNIAFIPISFGCNNFCTYCAVPYTRGNLIERPKNQIIEEIKGFISRGAKEIWLLGQNVNDYKGFPKLLKEVDNLTGNFKLFFTSPHPKNFSKKLIDTLPKLKKFGKMINLPIQSGDDIILRKMNRNYTVEEYKKIYYAIREKVPGIYISTDVILGFPGETEKQFQNTKKIFEELQFDNVYSAMYSPRLGTSASNLEDNIPREIKKRREREIVDIVKSKKAKIIAILGPTASGKSSIAKKIANKINGEIISVDSRQIYKEMVIGTDQDKENHLSNLLKPTRLIDTVKYQELTYKKIEEVLKRHNIPIIVGGSAFYLYPIIEGWIFPGSIKNNSRRKNLESKSLKELQMILKKKDLNTYNSIDYKNKVRVIRAIELIDEFGEIPEIKKEPKYNVLKIGIKKENTNELIDKRIDIMINKGLEKEVKYLVKKYGKRKVFRNTIGYQEWLPYFDNKITKKEVIQNIKTNTHQFSKRQMTWFKKDKSIIWLNKEKEIKKKIKDFLL